MTTNNKLTDALEAIVALVDEDSRFNGKSARDVLCSLYDYSTMSTDEGDYSSDYFLAMGEVIEIISGEHTLDMHSLARRVDSLIAFVDTEGDNFNE